MKNDCEVAIIIIERKWEKIIVDYIGKCNASKKYAKTI